MSEEKPNEKRKIGLLTKVSFAIFLGGLSPLLVGCIYSARFVIINELSDIRLSILNAPLSDKIVMVLTTVTLISFIVFLISLSSVEDEDEEEGE